MSIRSLPFPILLICFLILSMALHAQSDERPLRIFGYFQASFFHSEDETAESENSFNLQQLNVFFQKNFSREWSAFVNLETVNNFSSSRNWGSLNLEEAWVNYRGSRQFNLKMGLLIPEFNHLNTIKNRTPLLPYVIRPVAYESSFEDILNLEAYAPRRAFLQIDGYIPSGPVKLDYAVYLGNSPNINNNSKNGQTGIDTTAGFLVGSRVGLRYGELKAGVSMTGDKTNEFDSLRYVFTRQPAGTFLNRERIRKGADFSFHWNNFDLSAEYISVNYDEGHPEVDVDLSFVYGTIGYHITEKWFVYGALQRISDEFTFIYMIDSRPPALQFIKGRLDIKSHSMGFAWQVNDRVVFKGQFLNADFSSNDDFFMFRAVDKFYNTAISVFF